MIFVVFRFGFGPFWTAGITYPVGGEGRATEKGDYKRGRAFPLA
jgi:hypothetical protein